MRRWQVLLSVLVLAPPASGLTGLGDGGGEPLVRVGLERGPLEARAIEGAPSVLGEALDENWTRLDGVDPEPWRGYERTVQLRLGGNGTVLLADAESGLLVRAGANRSPGAGPGPPADGKGSATARGNGTESAGEDGNADPASDPSGTDAEFSLPAEGAAASPQPSTSPESGTNGTAAGADEHLSDQAGADRGSVEDEPGEAPEGRDPLLWIALGVSVAVGVGPWVVRQARKRLHRIGGRDRGDEGEGDAGGAGRVSDPRERFDDDRYPWMSPDSGGRDRRRR